MRIKRLLPILLMITGKVFGAWEQLPPLPNPNGGFACGVLDGKIVVLGGTNWKDNTKQWLDVIWVFDPTSRKWESHGRLPHPLAHAVTAEWSGDLVIAGGTDGTQPRKDVWRMEPSLVLKRTGELRAVAALAAGGVIGESLFIFGGCADPAKLDGLHKGGERLHLPSGKAAALASPGDFAFGLAASVVVGQELFIFGGARHDPVTQVVNLSTAWAFDAGKSTWRRLQPYPFVVRGASAVMLDQRHILIAGGYGGEPADFTAAAFIYDTRRDAYMKTMDLPIAALVGLVRAGDFVYCLGGEDKMKHRIATCARVRVDELKKAASID